MASGPAPGSHLTRVPDSERSLTLEVPAPKGSKATAVQKKKWAERTIVAMSKYDGFDMIRQEMAAQELAEMAATGDEGRTAVVEAGAIEPLVDLLGRGTALAKRWAAAALCAIAELRERAGVLTSDGHTSDVRVIVANANALEPLIVLLRYGGLRGQEQAAAALAVLWSADVGDIKVSVEAVLPALVSLLRRGSAAVKGAAATLVCCFAAEDSIVANAAILKADAIEPLATLLDDDTPTLVSFDGKPSTIGEEASSALQALGSLAAIWALDRLDADDADEAARAVLSEIGEEKQAAARDRAKRRQMSGPGYRGSWRRPALCGLRRETVHHWSRSWRGTRCSRLLMRRRRAGTPGPSVPS